MADFGCIMLEFEGTSDSFIFDLSSLEENCHAELKLDIAGL